jgi:thiol-disulfide isomerase/thioredoxin
MFDRSNLIVVAVAILGAVLGLLAGGWYRQPPEMPAPPGVSVLRKGDMRADPALADLEGQPRRLGEWDGRLVLVNFWATWCVPCREEFPDLLKLEKAYRARGLSVVGVSTDLAKDLPSVEKFLASAKPEFANYRKKSGGDDQVFIEAVDPKWGGELPFSVVYGPDGKKAKVLSGKQSYASFEKAVAGLLK